MDVRNCVNLTQAIDISKCINIEEIYFSGTKITGITLPDGGNIKSLHLPETLTKLTIKNQPLLTDLQLAGTANIESLWLENIPSTSIDARALVAQMKYNSAVRIIGMDESYESWEEIKAFYELLDTMSGLDYEGVTVNKAQVTGKIYVPNIPYADYVELSAKYPEVVINTDAIVCTVNFINEGNVHFVYLEYDVYGAVLNYNGLVGIVTKVEKNKCNVKLLTTDFNISVRINDTYGNLNDGIITMIDKYSDINIGDNIYTSGLDDVPGDIYVGEVLSVSLDKDELGKEVKAKLVDNNYLNYVYIVGNIE
jgi:hypothetical protein